MAIRAYYENREFGRFEDAYIMIPKIIHEYEDIEKIVPIDNEGDDGKLVYDKELVHLALAQVYPDAEARKNRAMSIGTMAVKFEWDGESDIFKTAYGALKDSYELDSPDNIEDC